MQLLLAGCLRSYSSILNTSHACVTKTCCASSQFIVFSSQKDGGLSCVPELRLGGAVMRAVTLLLHGHLPSDQECTAHSRLITELYLDARSRA